MRRYTRKLRTCPGMRAGSRFSRDASGRIGSSAEHGRNLDVPAPLENFHRDFVGVTAYLEVHAGLLELQVSQHQLVQKSRQAGVTQANFVCSGVGLRYESQLA